MPLAPALRYSQRRSPEHSRPLGTEIGMTTRRAGLVAAVKFLEPIKEKVPLVSWADVMQMASALSIEARPPLPARCRTRVHLK